MPVRQDSRKGQWFFRFKRNGRDYFRGGFRTSLQAKEAEVKALDKAIRDQTHPEQRGQEMTFREAADWWLTDYAPTKRSSANDRARIGLAARFFENRRLRDLQPEDIEKFLGRLSELRNEKISDHTRNHYLAMIRALFNRLKKKRKYMGENPAELVDAIKVPRARVRFLYPAEEKLLSPAIACNPDVWAFYFSALHTGMRINELRKIRVKDVDLILYQIFVPHPKNNRSRYVPISSELAEFLKPRVEGKNPESLMLPSWSYQYILRNFQKIAASVGIENLNLHDLRHTFASKLLTRGVPIYMVSKMLGHSGIAVTEQHYGHLAATDLTAALEKIKGIVSCSQVAARFPEPMKQVAKTG